MLRTKFTKQKTWPSLQMIVLIGLALVVAGYLSAAKPVVQEADIDTCADCHEDLAKAFMSKPCAVNKSCTACHGDAETHFEEGGGANIFAFKSTDIPNAKSDKCLTCHTKSNSAYFASPHGKASMDCTSCHVMHAEETNPSLLKLGATKTCYICHQEVFSEFQLNERHRLQEGIMDCTDCHDPHVPATRERLGGFKHESCFKCHPDKEGPYLYEHDASRIEGCSSCHDVHGNPNRHMLTFHSIADQCFSCHGAAPAWHERFDSYSTNCTSCHATIHGSNLSKIFLK